MSGRENGLPEAPASATVKVVSKDGFGWLFTMRDETVSGLMAKIEKMEDVFRKKGWRPAAEVVKEEREKETKKNGGYRCRECGAPAVFKSGTSKSGRHWRGIFCTANPDHVTWLRGGEK